MYICVCVYFREFKLFLDKNHRKITNNRLLCLCNKERTINHHHIHIKLKLIHCFAVIRFMDFGWFWNFRRKSSIRLWRDAIDYYYSIGSIILFINKVHKNKLLLLIIWIQMKLFRYIYTLYILRSRSQIVMLNWSPYGCSMPDAEYDWIVWFSNSIRILLFFKYHRFEMTTKWDKFPHLRNIEYFWDFDFEPCQSAVISFCLLQFIQFPFVYVDCLIQSLTAFKIKNEKQKYQYTNDFE